MESALCWKVLLGMGSPLKYEDKPSNTLSLDKVDLLFAGVWGTSILKASWLWVGLRVHFPFPVLGFCLVWTCAGHVCAAPVPELIMYVSVLLRLEDAVSLVSSTPPPRLLQSYCLFFRVDPWAWNGGLWKTYRVTSWNGSSTWRC